jgi:Xaa-Pro aminopeptidase
MIPNDEMERRRDVLRKKMEETGVGLILATSQENFCYLTGSFHPDLKVIPDRFAIAGLDLRGNVFAVVADTEYGLFKSQSSVPDAEAYVEFQDSPVAAVGDLLRKRGMVEKKVGLEAKHLVAHLWREMKGQLHGAELLPWDRYFNEARRIKSPFEIELLGRAALATEKVIYDTWKAATFGVSELEMAREMEYRLRKEGADAISFLTCVSGERTAVPHAVSSPLPIARGDSIKIDFGGIFGGYFSDMARTGFMAEVSPQKKAEYLRLVEAHKAIVGEMKPGVAVFRFFQKAREVFNSLGLPFQMPHLGHSLGLTLHEEPVLQPNEETEFTPGMVFAVEPRAKFRERERYHIEDVVLIAEHGPRVLTHIEANEEVFVIS